MDYRDLSTKIQTALEEQGKSTPSHRIKNHSYARISSSKISPNSQFSTKNQQRQTAIISQDWSKEAKHTSEYSAQFEPNLSPGAHLIPKRVHRWNLKNYAAIVGKMKALAKSKSTEMPTKVSLVKSSKAAQSEKKDKASDDLWRDLMKTNEERNFQIGRITNFFS